MDHGSAPFSEDVASTVIQSDFSTLHTKLIVNRADKRTVLLKVLWLPVWIKLPTVELFLEQFCQVLQCARETESIEGVTFSNGNVKVSMEMSEDDIGAIPYRTMISGKQCLITVVGRAPVCLKCDQIGHIRKNCTFVQQRKTVELSCKTTIPETLNDSTIRYL